MVQKVNLGGLCFDHNKSAGNSARKNSMEIGADFQLCSNYGIFFELAARPNNAYMAVIDFGRTNGPLRQGTA